MPFQPNLRTIALAGCALSVLAAGSAAAQTPATRYPGEAAFRTLYKEMVETDTSGATGSCTTLVEKVAVRLRAAGFPAQNIQVLAPADQPKSGNIVAIYPGSDPGLKAVLLLGHIDVVNAKRDEWERDPFTLIEEGGYFYGRGTSDMKAQSAVWADSMIRFHQEGYKPRRTIKMALTCGEEGAGFTNGAGWLVQNHRQLIDAGFALNEGGGGMLTDDGKPIAQTVLAATKRSMNFIVRANNPGGHSSRPRPDNALYSLARALNNLSQHHFPVQFNQYNKAYFSEMANIVGGEDGAAMVTLIANPKDAVATARLNRTVLYYNLLRSTCIPVLAEAGHAGNALPQRAQATLNCRVLPETPVEEVRATLVKWIDDPEIEVIAPANVRPPVPQPPLTSEVMDPIRRVSEQVFPGIPVVAWMGAGGTDAARLNPAGIPTYGVSGMFRDPDGGRAHGLNERIRVKSLMDGREFLHRLVKDFADQRR